MKKSKSILAFLVTVALIFVFAYYERLMELFAGIFVLAFIIFLYEKFFKKRVVNNNEIIKEYKPSTAFKVTVFVLLSPLLLVALIGGGEHLLDSGILPSWLEVSLYFVPAAIFTALFVYAFYRFSGIFIKDDLATPISIVVEQEKVSTKSNLPLQLTVGLFAASPFVCLFLFLQGGFEILILGPAALIIATVVVGVMIRIFRKNKSDTPTILVALSVVIISAFLARISVPIASDGDPINWFSANFLSADSYRMSSPLLSWFWVVAVLYFYTSFRYIGHRVVSGFNLKRIEKIAVPLVGVTLVCAYVLIVFSLKPAANQAYYDNELSNSYQKTFIERKASPMSRQKEIVGTNCAYASDMLSRASLKDKNASSYSVECVNVMGTIKKGGDNSSVSLPFESHDPLYMVVIPMSIKEKSGIYFGGDSVTSTINYKKGDIFAVTVLMPKGGSVAVDYEGNPALGYSGSGVYNNAQWQSSESYTKAYEDAIITILYPMNIEDESDSRVIKIVLANPGKEPKTIKLLEVARIRGPINDAQ